MGWIQNISKKAVATGDHYDAGPNAMLIQISDPAAGFPVPKHTFKQVAQFEFLDAEESCPYPADAKISRYQAKKIVDLLSDALSNGMNVVVHCHAGICRSGAVAEVGIMLGLDETGTYRQPNLMVKHYLMRELGWTYDENEKPTCTEDGVVVNATIYDSQSG